MDDEATIRIVWIITIGIALVIFVTVGGMYLNWIEGAHAQGTAQAAQAQAAAKLCASLPSADRPTCAKDATLPALVQACETSMQRFDDFDHLSTPTDVLDCIATAVSGKEPAAQAVTMAIQGTPAIQGTAREERMLVDLFWTAVAIIGLWVYVIVAMAVWRVEHHRYTSTERERLRGPDTCARVTFLFPIVATLLAEWASLTTRGFFPPDHKGISTFALMSLLVDVVGGICWLYFAVATWGGLFHRHNPETWWQADVTWARAAFWPMTLLPLGGRYSRFLVLPFIALWHLLVVMTVALGRASYRLAERMADVLLKGDLSRLSRAKLRPPPEQFAAWEAEALAPIEQPEVEPLQTLDEWGYPS